MTAKKELLPDSVVPEGEGPLSDSISVRLPKKLLERIEKCAKETENDRSATVLYLLRYAVTVYEAKGTK